MALDVCVLFHPDQPILGRDKLADCYLINLLGNPIDTTRNIAGVVFAGLLEALDAGKLAGAALDVLAVEPPPPDSKLLGRSDLLLTLHTAFFSVESLVDLQTMAAEEVLRVLQGQRPRNPVNPQVLGQAV